MCKVCTKCKKNKDETCFGKRSKAADGLQPWCKECISKRDKELAIKRNKKRKEETLPDGMKRCAQPCCNKILPLSKFQSTTARRTTPTATCDKCRAVLKKSQENPTSATGKCRAYWIKWKKMNPCEHEGGCEFPHDWRLIQADHVEPKAQRKKRTGESGHHLSDWVLGGPATAQLKRWKRKQRNARRCASSTTESKRRKKDGTKPKNIRLRNKR